MPFKQHAAITWGRSQQRRKTAEFSWAPSRLPTLACPTLSQALLRNHKGPWASHCNTVPKQQHTHILGAASDQRIQPLSEENSRSDKVGNKRKEKKSKYSDPQFMRHFNSTRRTSTERKIRNTFLKQLLAQRRSVGCLGTTLQYHSYLDQNSKFHPSGIVQRDILVWHKSPRCAMSLFSILQGCRHAPHLSHSISAAQTCSQTQAGSPCWRDCPFDFTNKVTYSCQNKKSVSFPSLQSARLGIILECFTKWLKDWRGFHANIPWMCKPFQSRAGELAMLHCPAQSQWPLSSLLPLKTCCLHFIPDLCTRARQSNENNALLGVKTTISTSHFAGFAIKMHRTVTVSRQKLMSY